MTHLNQKLSNQQAELHEAIQQAIQDGVPLTPTNLQRHYLQHISKQAVFLRIKAYKNQRPESEHLFMSNREKCFMLFEMGKTIDEVVSATGLSIPRVYSYRAEFKGGSK